MAEKYTTKVEREPLTGAQREIAERAIENVKRHLTEKLESNTEYQERKRMSADGRGRKAIDDLASDMVRLNREQGKEMNFEHARKYMEDMAYGAERKTK